MHLGRMIVPVSLAISNQMISQAVTTFTRTHRILLFGAVLCAAFLGIVLGGWMIGVFILLACVTPALALLLNRFASAQFQRTSFKTAAWLAFITALPLIGLAAFFLFALMQQRGSWNPAPDEAVIVPLVWLGAVLLPVCGWRLWRAKSSTMCGGGSTQTEAREAARVKGSTFGALVVAVLLLLAASGDAMVMMFGSAALLVLGMTWFVRHRWRMALLVALASMGVAGAVVLLLSSKPPGQGDMARRVAAFDELGLPFPTLEIVTGWNEERRELPDPISAFSGWRKTEEYGAWLGT
jgi:hypothetical protein